MTCQHNYTTKQSRVPIKGGGPSQEILGELTFTVCLACEHVEGTFSSASLFNPKSEPIEAPDYVRKRGWRDSHFEMRKGG